MCNITEEKIGCCFFNYNIIFVEEDKNWTQYKKSCIIV